MMLSQKLLEKVFKCRVRRHLKFLDNTFTCEPEDYGIDFLLCIHGMFVALKVSLKNDSAELKAKTLTLINNSGGLGILVRPSNWGKVLIILKALSEGKSYDRTHLGTDLKSGP